MAKKSPLEALYDELSRLEAGLGGKVLNGRIENRPWPKRGLYFFFEPNEFRSHLGCQRVTRVGTHGVSKGSKSTLWNRLSTHFGSSDGFGNHRSSVFRLHVGAALMVQNKKINFLPSWGKAVATPDERLTERPLENLVSKYIRSMSILYLSISDDSGPQSDRAYLERNLIATLSAYNQKADKASARWLGHCSANIAIQQSHLWNVNHVREYPDIHYIKVLRHYVDVTLGKVSESGPVAPNGWHKGQGGQMQLV
jgi:hypothetical protein